MNVTNNKQKKWRSFKMEERTSARSKGTNRVEVPEARGALKKDKRERGSESINYDCFFLIVG